MIRLGLRLTVNGGREAVVRLVITALAVALGVGMLLLTLACINAVHNQNSRYAWLETGAVVSSRGPSTADPLYWLLTGDEFQGRLIGRVDVAGTGTQSPIPPGMDRLPGPGEYYASPALSALLRATPRDELAARYPGRQIGTIGAGALPSPNSLIIVVGRTAAQLAATPGVQRVTSISRVAPDSCNHDCVDIGVDGNGVVLILAVAAAALIFPVLIFIGTATRLCAARREQRFAAMRLVGATPHQVALVAAVESCVAAVTGAALGFGLFYAVRAPVAAIPFTGAPFYESDLSLTTYDVITVAVGVPIAAAVAARLALRRVNISPLGVTRRVTPQPPRAYRLVPLALGLGLFAYYVQAGQPRTTNEQALAYTSAFILTLLGLVVAGPWLTMIGSRVMARRARRPAMLIAGRRLADDPKSGFRAISGLIVALFVTGVAVGVITTIDAYDGGREAGRDAAATLVSDVAGLGVGHARAVPPGMVRQVAAIAGVRGVAVVRLEPQHVAPGHFVPPVGLVDCRDLSRIPELGACASARKPVARILGFPGSLIVDRPHPDRIAWPAANLTQAQLTRLPALGVVVGTDGSRAAVEQARTVLESAGLSLGAPQTVTELDARRVARTVGYERLAEVVILTSLPIAGCSLAVSIAAGLSERRRPFSLLRLSGAPLAVLRRVVALESVVPLVAIAAVSIGTAFLTSSLFLRSQLQESLQWPGRSYYVSVVAGLVASVGIVASTLPLLDRVTGPEAARTT